MSKKYFCCDEKREAAVTAHSTMNGIKYLEVLDGPQVLFEKRQRTLYVHFIKETLLDTLNKGHISIEGGERIKDIIVAGVSYNITEPRVLEVHVDKPGDFSVYTLRLVKDDDNPEPPDGFDPILCAVDFSFKVNCPSDFDCRKQLICPQASVTQPDINYLAKDYESFRQLILDRISLLVPDWKERNPADIGIVLSELLAYVGDQLSYQQDAIATEAYIGTARSRISVRRHARMVDYLMHDGRNAQVLIQFNVEGGSPVELKREFQYSGKTYTTQFFTMIADQEVRILPGALDSSRPISKTQAVFELKNDEMLYPEHNEIPFYTWGDCRCCLPKGSTKATLSGHFPNMRAGDVLIFCEVIGPRTGRKEDADASHRHAVRLTHVILKQDPVGGLFLDTPNDMPVDITEIQWAAEDALPFPLCISSTTDKEYGQVYISGITVTYGNIVHADHGETIHDEYLGEVQESLLYLPPDAGGDPCQHGENVPIPPRFRPRLKMKPLTNAIPCIEDILISMPYALQYQTDLDNSILPNDLSEEFEKLGIFFHSPSLSIQGEQGRWSISDGTHAYIIRGFGQRLDILTLPEPVSTLITKSSQEAIPAIILNSEELSGNKEAWHPRRDLLNSSKDDRHFIVESETDGTSYLRFGDDLYGRRPNTGTRFMTTYRIGNGKGGNVGAGMVVHVLSDAPGIKRVWNPLPALGGTEPESVEEVRRDAPYAFRVQERAVTPKDYADVAQRHPQVQHAVAAFRWTGSWHTVFLTIDRFGGLSVDQDFKKKILRHLERYRMAGYDIEINGPHFVSLEIEMLVCVKQEYFRSDVKAVLLQVFSNGMLPNGRPGIFHPDNFTFGQPVFLSPLYAAAQAVEGVDSVWITKFQRQGNPNNEALEKGRLEIGQLEIARLENNPNFAERGVLRLNMRGGK